jgi:malate dehydrogenase (oxaloacetate-decarboxylating)(NADP+)
VSTVSLGKMVNRDGAGFPHGVELLRNPILNKGTAFTEDERDALGLRGLLPPAVHSQNEHVVGVLENFRRKPTDLEKYIFMTSVQDRDETLFHRMLMDYPDEMMVIMYTPTVGQACQEYSHIFRRPRGMFVSAKDRGRVADVLCNWPHDDVRIIVVTDGERILGLGDLGANGMGIPVGKAAMYTACAGVDPSLCMPVTIDVGTDNQALLNDPFYIGIRQRRLRGQAYDDLIDEFITGSQAMFPNALIHFEDFANANASRLLKKYKNTFCAFNDDIQGTAAVVLAGLYSSLQIIGGKLKDQRILFLGAGESATGIGGQIVWALCDEGLSEEEARQRCWFVDSKGLVVRGRDDLAEHKRPYAHEHEFIRDFHCAVETIKPTVIIGASGQPGMFTRQVLQSMAKFNETPIVFALSNPTSKAECTAEEAYEWTEGRAIFASGSPFEPVTVCGKTYSPSQGNNAYIFPGVGLGAVVCGARHITDEMFFAAAKTLAGQVSQNDLKRGRIFPSLRRIRDVSAVIAEAVAEIAYSRGLATTPRPQDLLAHIKSRMYEPKYQTYV